MQQRKQRPTASKTARPMFKIAGGILIALVLVAGGWAIWYEHSTSRFVGAADPTNMKLVSRGHIIYSKHCASCHGSQLEGQPNWKTRLPSGRLPAPPHDASGHTWHHPDDVLFAITKGGPQAQAPEGYQSDMPAFGNLLSDPDIWAVLAYIKSTWPKQIQQKHSLMNRAVQSQE